MSNSFVKFSAVLVATVGSASIASAQSNVQLYGIVDAAIRSTSNHGKTQMVGGGMSQSRWGINVNEDLGNGVSVIANLENRFLADTGNNAVMNYFQQAWVGVRDKDLGQMTMGRQYNVLLDIAATTYASFPNLPFMEVYKPEIGFSMGARANNMLKYMTSQGAWRAGIQYSFDEGNTTSQKGPNVDITGTLAMKTTGGYLRYADKGFAIGGAYLNSKMPGGTDFDAYTLGGSYRNGPWYFSTGYAINKRKNTLSSVDARLISAYWGSEINGGFASGDSNKRQMIQFGIGNQINTQLNFGMHYYYAMQSGSPSGAFNNKASFFVAVADYAFSKRTSAYIGVDYTRVRGGEGSYIEKTATGTPVRSRAGATIGLRHRF